MEKPAAPPDGKELESLCSTLKVIANPNRLRILILLIEGEFSVGEIESALRIKQPTLSQELRNLRDSGLVSTRRESKVIFYSVINLTENSAVRGLIHNLFPNRPESVVLPRSTQRVKINRQGECGYFSTVDLAR